MAASAKWQSAGTKAKAIVRLTKANDFDIAVEASVRSEAEVGLAARTEEAVAEYSSHESCL